MKNKAFTIIELLVVIAIIFLLLSTLIPALQNTRETAKTVMCSSNIKQIVIALETYEYQNHTFPYSTYYPLTGTPPTGDYAGMAGYDGFCWWWFDFISDISGTSRKKGRVLWCPARNIRESYNVPNILLGNYGINEAICKTSLITGKELIEGVPLSVNQITKASETMLLMDSGYSVITWYHAAEPNISPIILQDQYEDSGYVPGLEKVNSRRGPFRPGVDLKTDLLIGRHPNKAVNAGFVDGHVSTLRSNDFYVQKAGDVYANRSPLWLP